MNREREMYRMSEAERFKYLTMLFAGREQEASEFREECHRAWVAKGVVPGKGEPCGL